MADETDTHFSFTVEGLAAEAFRVARFKGVEGVSRLYRVELELVSVGSALDERAVLAAPATLTITVGAHSRAIHGLVGEFQRDRQTPTGEALCRAVLVPRLAGLELSRQCQIYGPDGDVTVEDVLRAELLGEKVVGLKSESVLGLAEEDVAFRLTRTYPTRDYVVQYAESDFNFVSRLMEHWGIFYFFDHSGAAEKCVITDDSVRCEYLPDGAETVRFAEISGLARPDYLVVHTLRSRVRRLPRKLVLRDYNYRKPDVALRVDKVVDAKGQGVVALYGEHFKTEAEGDLLAGIRVQELLCRQTEYVGDSTHPGFCAGFLFTLSDHYWADFNQDYLLTEIRHFGEQPLAELAGQATQAGGTVARRAGYRNSFTAVPAAVAFRPERATPKPRIDGLINAHIESEDLDTRADMDDEGRYKVRTQFDLSGRGRGTASRFTRKAEPYGGSNQGMHFPLVQGTEVILAHVNGDPDRPIIVGCVPNPNNPSVVNSTNYTRNRIRTTSGITQDMNDGTSQSGVASAVEVPLYNGSGASAGAGAGAGAGSGTGFQVASDSVSSPVSATAAAPVPVASVAAAADAAVVGPADRRTSTPVQGRLHLGGNGRGRLPGPSGAWSISRPSRKQIDIDAYAVPPLPPGVDLGPQAKPAGADISGGSAGSTLASDSTYYRLYVPDDGAGASVEESYLRLGAYDSGVENGAIAAFSSHGAPTSDEARCGWYDYTDGSHISTATKRYTGTLSDETYYTVGDQNLYVEGVQKYVIGDTTAVSDGGTLDAEVQDEDLYGSRNLKIRGNEDVSINGNTTWRVGGNLDWEVSGSSTITFTEDVTWVDVNNNWQRTYGSHYKVHFGAVTSMGCQAKTNIWVANNFNLMAGLTQDFYLALRFRYMFCRLAVTTLKLDIQFTKLDITTNLKIENDVSKVTWQGIDTQMQALRATKRSLSMDFVEGAKLTL